MTSAVALLGAAIVFTVVMLTTPPGFNSLGELLLGIARGPNAEGAAYALGAASTLALLTLVVLGALGFAVDSLRRRGS